MLTKLRNWFNCHIRCVHEYNITPLDENIGVWTILKCDFCDCTEMFVKKDNGRIYSQNPDRWI